MFGKLPGVTKSLKPKPSIQWKIWRQPRSDKGRIGGTWASTQRRMVRNESWGLSPLRSQNTDAFYHCFEQFFLNLSEDPRATLELTNWTHDAQNLSYNEVSRKGKDLGL